MIKNFKKLFPFILLCILANLYCPAGFAGTPFSKNSHLNPVQSSLESLTLKMSLKELVEYGIQNSPSMKSSRSQIQLGKWNVENAKYKFFPSLDMSADHGYRQTSPTSIENPWASSLSLSLSENLYMNGDQWTQYEIEKIKSQISQLEFQRDRGNYCLSLYKMYTKLSESNETLRIQQFQFSLLQKQYASMAGRYERGETTRTDYLRMKARLQRSQLTLDSVKVSVQKTTEELKAFLAWPQEQELNIQLMIPGGDDISSSSENHWEPPTQISGHYEYRLSLLNRKVYEKEVRLVERKYWPEVYFTLEGTYSNSAYLSGGRSFNEAVQREGSVLLTLKYNLWDFGTRKRNLEIARVEKDQSHLLLDQKILNLKADLKNLNLDYSQLKKNFSLSRELVKLEKTNFDSLSVNYRNGRSTFLDLMAAVDNLTNAEDLFSKNYFELRNTEAEFKYFRGKLYEYIVNQNKK